MRPEWADEIEQIHQSAVKKSGIVPWASEDVRFLTLALAGEVGELANMIKKHWRGDIVPHPGFDAAVHAELADIRVYLHLLATALPRSGAHLKTVVFGIDLDEAVKVKLPAIRDKFLQLGEKPADWDAKHRQGG